MQVEKIQTWIRTKRETIEELEQEFECKIIRPNELCKKLNCARGPFFSYAKNGLFDEYCLYCEDPKGFDVLNSKGPKRLFLEPFIPYYKELLQGAKDQFATARRSKSLVPDFELATKFGIGLSSFRQQLKDGIWGNAIVEETFKDNGQPMYFVSKAVIAESPYKTLSDMAPFVGISRDTLYEYRRRGLIQQPSHLLGTHLWDLNDLIPTIQALNRSKKERYYKNSQERIQLIVQNKFSLLNKVQQQTAESYLRHRSNLNLTGVGVMYRRIGKKHRLKSLKNSLSKIIAGLICVKCQVPFHAKMTERSVPEGFDADKLDLTQITSEDLTSLKEVAQWSEETFLQEMQIFKPFMVYIVLKHEVDIDDPGHKFYLSLDRRYKRIIEQIPAVSRNAGFSEDKLYLNHRDQVLKVYELIWSVFDGFLALTYATMWMISCFIGIRPEEMEHLKTSYFKRNPETGMLVVDSDGYGSLIIPEKDWHNFKTPPYPNYQLEIVPELVKLCNKYLSELYKSQGSMQDGWLFRPQSVLHLPQVQNRSSYYRRWTKKLQPLLDFVEEEKRKRFQLKTGRSSMNNFMFRYALPDPSITEFVKKCSAAIQMRHSLKRVVADTMGIESYTMPITKEEHRRVIDLTLNFPWDLEELKAWEIQHGYRKQDQDESHDENDALIVTKTVPDYSKIQSLIAEKESRLNQIARRPKNMTVRDWSMEQNQLRTEITRLKSQIS